MSIDDRYIIDTPENIEFGYDIAGIGSRFLAAIIDTFIIIVTQGIILMVVGYLGRNSDVLDSDLYIAIISLIGFVILWGYYIMFEMIWNGQSPGKRLIGLRVVREGGRPVTFLSSAIRNLIRIVDFLPWFYGIGVITMFIDGRARRLGDLAAGTLVVKESKAVTLESLTPSVTARPSIPTSFTDSTAPVLPNVQLLTGTDYQLIQEFLARRNDLGRDARVRLATQLAGTLQTRLALPLGGDPEAFLQYAANEYRRHQWQEHPESTGTDPTV